MKTENLVFVVEDSEVFCFLLSQQLSRIGNYVVKSFSDGSKMLSDLYLKPKAILLDYYLDRSDKNALNGKEIVELMKTLKYKIPVIVFSGMENPQKLLELKQMGIHDFIFKNENNFLDHLKNSLKSAVVS